MWLLLSPTKLNVFILDKTVLTSDVQEHLSLSWVLNNEKYQHSSVGAYHASKDYFGFFPDDKGNYSINDVEKYSQNELDSLANQYDAAFYTDMYGIYNIEWQATYYPQEVDYQRKITNRSEKIYGGLSQKDLDFLRLMKQKRKLIVNEFNIIASPTSSDIRRQYEEEFHLHWTGWVGRYFDNLDTLVNMDIPRWLIDNYMKQNKQHWPFKKSGIAFVRTDDKIVILEKNTHLYIDIPYIYTSPENCLKYKVSPKMKYPFWFDIIEIDSTLQLLSSYRIQPNQKGDSLLRANLIPKHFPALITSKSDYPFYYMAGDFSDNPISMRSSYFRYIHFFAPLTYSKEEIERNSFFWDYYRPLVKEILSNYSN